MGNRPCDTIGVMKVVTPRRLIWKILGFLLAIVLICLGAMWIWIGSIASRRHLRMREQIRELHAETLARTDVRPALHGETLSGSGWPSYSLALAETKKMRRDEDLVRDVWYETPNADPGRFGELLSVHGVVLDHLREGARRNSGTPPLTWKEGWSLQPPLYDAELLARFVTCAARFQAQKGDPAGAVLKILDVLQFARDLSANSTRHCTERSAYLWNIATLELKEIVFSNEFPRQDLTVLDDALARLDRHLPDAAPILLNETLRLGFDLLKPDDLRSDHFLLRTRDRWRYGFSQRIVDADGFDLLLTYVRKAAPLQDVPLPKERSANRGLFLPYHPLFTRATNAGVFQSMGRMRGMQAILRLLRVAVHYRATGEILELADPYGDQLHHAVIGSDLKVWSVGLDGVDHDGDNAGRDWSKHRPRPIPGQPARPWREARDIVLEVER